MANGFLLVSDDVAAISAAEATTAGFGPENLLDDQPRVFAESALATLTLDVDMGAAVMVDTVAVLATNAAMDATWSLRAAGSQAGLDSAPALLAEAFPAGADMAAGAPVHGVGLVDATAAQWWRIAIDGGAVSGGQLRAGRLMLGRRLQPVWNFETGARWQRRAAGRDVVTYGGALVPAARPSRRRLQIQWGDLTDDEYYGQLAPIEQRAAEGAPVLFMRDPGPAAPWRHSGVLYGRMTLAQGAARTRGNEWRASAVIEEMT